MKKLSLIGLTFLMLFLVNCSKDDTTSDNDTNTENSSNNGNSGSQNTLEPVPVTVTSTTASTVAPYSNLLQINRENKSAVLNVNATETMNIEYEAGTRLILKKNITSGSDLVVDEYFYKDAAKGLLDSIVETKNGVVTGVKKYTIDANDHILKIETFDDNDNLMQKYEYSNFNGEKPQNISIFIVSAQGNYDLSGDLTYTGDNVTSLNLTGTFDSYSMSVSTNITYDNKKLPFSNVLTKEDVSIYVNNTTRSVAEVTVDSYNLTTTTTYSHQYNSDDYPISTDISVSSSYVTDNSTLEYVYEDR